MSPARCRWILAGFFVLTVPWPMPGPFDALAPPVRYLMLASAAGRVALAEGAAGPLPLLIGLLCLQAIGTVLLSWAAASLLARVLARLPERRRMALVVGPGMPWLVTALVFDVYRTPFGDAGTGTLLDVLFS